MRRTLAIVVFGLGISLLIPSASDAQWLKVGEIQAGKIYTLVVNGERLYAATDEGLFASVDGGARWSLPSRELSGFPVFDLAVKGRQIHAATTHRGVFVSADNGTSWRMADSGLIRPRSIVLGESLSVAMMGEKTFLGTGTGVFMSLDGEDTWATADAGLRESSYIESLAVIEDTLFVSPFLKGVFLTKNDGEDWEEVNEGLPVDRSDALDRSNVWVNCLGAVGDTLLAGTQEGVFRLDSSLDELRWVRSGLQDKDVTDLVFVGGVVFAGVDEGGLFRSEDAGVHWVSSNTGLPGASV